MNSWKILRILTTNICNYRCIYCHNEGQDVSFKSELLSVEDVILVVNAINGTGVKEIRFSGGEPLANPCTIEMIEWVNDNTNYEIGLATNGSLVTEEIAKRLGKTRILVTVHFPATNEEKYRHVTGQSLEGFQRCVELLEKEHIKHSFNYVLYPETVGNIGDVLQYTIEHGKRIKLLPFIEKEFHNYSDLIVKEIYTRFSGEKCTKTKYDKEGIFVWEYENGGKIKLLDSPCYGYDLQKCKEYGEVRLLPKMALQSCIFDDNSVSIKGMAQEEIRSTLKKAWSGFTRCYGLGI